MANKTAKKRLINEKSLFSNKEYDGTTHLDLFLKSEVDYFTYTGQPARLHFYITKNNNSALTKENGLLDLSLPIIPACFDINSTRSLSEFITNGEDQETIKQKIQSQDRAKLDKRIDNYADKMLLYIKNEIAIRYAVAKQNKDLKTMNLLSNLSVMKDFDLELYSLLLKQPIRIVESKAEISTQDNKYILVYLDGTIVPITKKQYRSINSYAYSYNRYVKAKEKFFSLSKVLNDYEDYQISRDVYDATIPTHSVIAKGVSTRTNNRVVKANTSTESKTSGNKNKQSQPGDE